jgi:hypothetical protein
MPGPLVMIAALAVGVILATWGRLSWRSAPEDRVLMFLGLLLGGILGWATVDPWYLLGLLVVGPLIVLRRRRAR